MKTTALIKDNNRSGLRFLAAQFLVLLTALAGVVSESRAYNVKRVTANDGLTNSSILSFGRVRSELMLIGTCDGVNCFDGKRIFPLQFVDGSHLSGSVIEDIVVDKDDRGWILTNHGLSVIQRTKVTKNIERFNSARAIRLDAGGKLAVLMDSTLYCQKGDDTLFVRLPLKGDAAEDILDFVMTDKKLFLFRQDGVVSYSLQRSGEDYSLGSRSVVDTVPLQAASFDDDNEFLVESDGMLWSFDFKTSRRQPLVSLRDEIAGHGSISSVRSLKDRIFVCFTASGVVLLEPQGSGYAKRDMGIEVGVMASYKNQGGDIMWLGTDGQGVIMIIDEPETRRSLTADVLRLRQRKPFRTILADGNGTLWLGTKGDGLLEIPHFDFDNIGNNLNRRFLRREDGGLAGNSVFALLPSSRLDGFWIATNGGLSFRSRSGGMVIVPTEMPVTWISALCERGDTLWLTTQGMGVYRGIISGTAAAPRLVDMKHYTLDGGKKTSNYFFSMASRPGGSLYFGNRGMGLYTLVGDILKWIKPEVETDYSLGLSDIFAILPTAEGLWIGTGYGVSFRGNDGRREFYTTKNGMPNNVVHAMTEDNQGNVWVSTNKGLVRFLRDSHVIRIFGETDNMEVNEYSDGAAFTHDSIVYFGGINGVSIVSSDVSKKPGHPSTTFEFTGLTINGESANINEHLRLGKNQTLKLAYYENTLMLRFSNFDYKSPSSYTYYYSLSKNGPWINNGSSSEIYLTRLSTGSHTLYVKSLYHLTGEESQVYELEIDITPPWYLSWWAKLLYLLMALAAGYVSYRRWHRHRQVRAQILKAREDQARRDELYEQKMHFMTNLVHELNTPLTLVYGPCERILSHQGIDNFVRKYVHMIQANMGRLNHLIKDIIDLRRLDSGFEKPGVHSVAVGEWVMEFYGAFKDMAAMNRLTYECDIMKDLVWNTDERYITRIVTNLISNAFKYTKPEGTIRVNLHRTDDNQLYFSVYNSGKGIAESDRQRIFDYYQVLENVEESSLPGFASRNGLGMAICHNAVKQLGGTIDIDSVVGEYACFIVKIPWRDLPEGAGKEPLMPTNVQVPSYYRAEQSPVAEPLPAEPEVDRAVEPVRPEAAPAAGGESTTKESEPLPAAASRPPRNREKRVHRDGVPTVLVIDDNVDILELLEDTLSDDYNVLTAERGEQGLEVLKQIMPDLIITDIMMPGMDGLELTYQLKQNKHTMYIPLVILSSKRSDDEQVEGLESGADAYVSKPFSTQYLLATVARLLENRKVLREYYNTSASAYTYQNGKLMTGEEREFREQVMAVINKNLTNADFTPDDLAREMAISQRNLYRKFSDAGLPTPKEYIKNFKIEHAARQLTTTNLTIQEIIYSSGFNTRSQFYTEFRKHYGITPKEFREQRRVRDDSLE